MSAAAAPAFNPPSRDVNEYSAQVYQRANLKVGKYYVMSLYDTPSSGSIVKVTGVTPVPPTGGRPGTAKITVQEEGGSILPPLATGAYKFFEYRIPVKNISIPDEMESNEPLGNNERSEHNALRRKYQGNESIRLSAERFYTRRGRKARKTRKARKARKATRRSRR